MAVKNTETVPSATTETEVEVLEVQTVSDENTVTEVAPTDEKEADNLRKLAEDKFGEDYIIEKIVSDGDIVNVVARSKDSDTSVALRLEK